MLISIGPEDPRAAISRLRTPRGGSSLNKPFSLVHGFCQQLRKPATSHDVLSSFSCPFESDDLGLKSGVLKEISAPFATLPILDYAEGLA